MFVCSLLTWNQTQNSSTFIHKFYNKKLLKEKLWTCRWENMNPEDEVLKQLFNALNFWVCASFPYTENGNWSRWINLEKYDFIADI